MANAARTSFLLFRWLPDTLAYLRTRVFWRAAIPYLLTFFSFLLAAQMGAFLFRVEGTAPTLVWPAVGIALAAVILEGYRALIPIALASATNVFLNDAPYTLVLFSVLGNVLQPAIYLFILRKLDFDRKLGTPKDMITLVMAGLCISMVVPSMNALGVLTYEHFFDLSRPIFWSTWWVGGALGAITLTPFLIRWIRRPIFRRTTAQLLEVALALILLTVFVFLTFATPYTSFFGIPLAYPILATLFWMAFRCGPRFLTLALLLFTIISIAGTIYGVHETGDTLSERVFSVQVFDLFIAVFFFILVSVEEQRKDALKIAARSVQEAEAAFKKLRVADIAKNEFIATLAHELRNPLAPLLTSIELLKDTKPEPKESERLLSIMQDRVWVMSRLLEDLLDIARITERKIALKKEPTDLRETLEHASDAILPFIKKRGHRLHLQLPERTIVNVDPARLEQVFMNLLNNAAKYTPEGGTISLSTTFEADRLKIRVADTGVGIPEEKVSEIFEPFTQLGHNESAGGIGIGLYLTKQLVELHEGRVSVRSNSNGPGSEFTVSLPKNIVIDITPPSSPPDEIPDEQKFPGRPMVLVVDDNEEAAVTMGKLLQAKGYNTYVAHNGRDAIEAALSTKPSVMLLDIGLPDISGHEVAKRLRAEKVPTILVALTGYGLLEDKEAAMESGFDHHLVKPVGFSDLKNILETVKPSL